MGQPGGKIMRCDVCGREPDGDTDGWESQTILCVADGKEVRVWFCPECVEELRWQ